MPGPQPGAALTYGGNGQLYAIMGGGTNAFLRYDIPSDTWYVINSNTPTFFAGAALVADTLYRVLYALRGGGTSEFWQYNIPLNAWLKVDDIPEPVDAGGALAFGRRGNYYFMYAIIGNTSKHFYQYGPYLPSGVGGPQPKGTHYRWDRLKDMTSGAKPGACIAWIYEPEFGLDSVFCAPCCGDQAGERKKVFAYSPSDNDWYSSRPLEHDPGYGTAMASISYRPSILYQLACLIGDPTQRHAAWRLVYPPPPKPWNDFSTPPEYVCPGAAIAYGQDSYYYAFFGGGNKTFAKVLYYDTYNPGGEQVSGVTQMENQQFFANPNPFSNKTVIRFSVLHSSRYQAKIYNAAGELVHTLLDQQLNPGTHSLTWNRCSDAKTQVPAGVYLLRLEAANGNQQSLKLVVR